MTKNKNNNKINKINNNKMNYCSNNKNNNKLQAPIQKMLKILKKL